MALEADRKPSSWRRSSQNAGGAKQHRGDCLFHGPTFGACPAGSCSDAIVRETTEIVERRREVAHVAAAVYGDGRATEGIVTWVRDRFGGPAVIADRASSPAANAKTARLLVFGFRS